MPRENNAMSGTEICAFLRSAEWVALGVLDETGGPAATVVPAVVKAERLYFAVAPASPAQVALTRDSRCCCAIDVFPSYYEIKGATVHGRAARVDPDPALGRELERRARTHGLASGVVYAVPILEDSFGFDFAKLARR